MKLRAVAVLGALALLLASCHNHYDNGYDFGFEVGPTVDPDPPIANQAFDLRFRARNSGDWDAEDVRWTVYRDGTEVATGLIDLDDHESRDVVVLMGPDTAGTHTYRVELDRHDSYNEDDEGDNEAAITVTIAAMIVHPG